MKNFLIPFFTILSLFTFIAWLGGYNFDGRGVDVACWAVLGLVISALFALFVWV